MTAMRQNQCTQEHNYILGITNTYQQAPVRRSPLLASFLAHVLAAALIFSVAAPENLRQAGRLVTPLFAPAQDAKPVPRKTRPVATLPVMAPAPLRRDVPPRISAPIPGPQPMPEPLPPQLSPAPKPLSASAAIPAIEPTPPRPAAPVTTGVFTAGNSSPAWSPGPSKPAVQTGTFSAAAETANRSVALSHPQTGGFDAGRAAANRLQSAPAPVSAGFAGPAIASRFHTAPAAPSLGAFGESVAADTASARSAAPSVAGFGSPVNVAASPPPRQPGPAITAFESVVVNLAPVAPAATDGAAGRYKPVEILQKPRPAYSQEARRLQLEGEVNLDAVFGSTGRVRVTRVLRGLGHGLDESAIQAARAIQFRPATVNGSPVDVAAIVKITFQLAY